MRAYGVEVWARDPSESRQSRRTWKKAPRREGRYQCYAEPEDGLDALADYEIDKMVEAELYALDSGTCQCQGCNPIPSVIEH